jgi:hypothetical protein
MAQAEDIVDLGDFIAEVLTQINNGISKAQVTANEKKAAVNPINVYMPSVGQMRIDASGGHDRQVQNIEFDIAVTAAKKSGVQSGTGVVIPVLALGLQGKKEFDNSMVSRIKFSIPVAFPQQFD